MLEPLRDQNDERSNWDDGSGPRESDCGSSFKRQPSVNLSGRQNWEDIICVEIKRWATADAKEALLPTKMLALSNSPSRCAPAAMQAYATSTKLCS